MTTSKGGVGKSWCASLLVQYLQHVGRPVRAYDIDPLNRTLHRTAGLSAEPVAVLDGEMLDGHRTDQLVEDLLHLDGDGVLDTGSASFVPFNRYLVDHDIVGLLETAGADVTIHVTLSGNPDLMDTLRSLDVVIASYPASARIIAWRNEYHGQLTDEGVRLDDMEIYRGHRARLAGEIVLRELPPLFLANLKTMLGRRLTFAEALLTGPDSPGFNTVERQRLHMIRREIFDQLAAVLGP